MSEIKWENYLISHLPEELSKSLIETQGKEVDFSVDPRKKIRKCDRELILAMEGSTFPGGESVLRLADLNDEVMRWRIINSPDPLESATNLHWIKKLWISENPERVKENPDGWRETLKTDEWKKFIPSTDSGFEVDFFG